MVIVTPNFTNFVTRFVATAADMGEGWQGTSDFIPEEIGKLENIFTFQVFLVVFFFFFFFHDMTMTKNTAWISFSLAREYTLHICSLTLAMISVI